jgi:hypothetical protein
VVVAAVAAATAAAVAATVAAAAAAAPAATDPATVFPNSHAQGAGTAGPLSFAVAVEAPGLA